MDDLGRDARRPVRDVEDRLRRLVESDELRGLPGEGAPLPPDPDADAGAAWAARHLARNAHVAPEWADLRRDIDERTARLRRRLRAHERWLADRATALGDLPADRIVEATRATRRRDERVRAEIVSSVAELNALIRRYDLKVIPPLQLPLVTVEKLRV